MLGAITPREDFVCFLVSPLPLTNTASLRLSAHTHTHEEMVGGCISAHTRTYINFSNMFMCSGAGTAAKEAFPDLEHFPGAANTDEPKS